MATSAPMTGPERSVMTEADTTKAAAIEAPATACDNGNPASVTAPPPTG